MLSFTLKTILQILQCWGLFWFSLFLKQRKKKDSGGISKHYIFFSVAKVNVINSETTELWSFRRPWKKKQKCWVILPQLCSFSFQQSKIQSLQGCMQDHLTLYLMVAFTSLSSSRAFCWTLVKLLASEKLKIAMNFTVQLCTECKNKSKTLNSPSSCLF